IQTDSSMQITGFISGTYVFRWSVSARNIFVCPEVFDEVTIEVAPPASAGNDATYCDVTSIQLVAGINTTGTWTLDSTTGNPLDVDITQSPSISYIANATVVPGESYVFTFTTDTYVFSDTSTCLGNSDSVNVEIFAGPSIEPV